MSKYYDQTGIPSGPGLKRKHPWITFLKVCGWVLGCLIVLAGIAVWIISYRFTPQHITKLIEEKAGEYLNAKIGIGKLEYKLFRTYPWFEFEIDSLTVISESLDCLSPSQIALLPANSDSLAFVDKLRGKVNIHDLLHNKLRIKNIEVDKPFLNIVIFNDSVSNFNIMKEKLPKMKKLPDVDISEIKVEAPLKLSFFSYPLDAEANARVETFTFVQDSRKVYDIGFEGIISARYEDIASGEVPVKFKTNFKTDLAGLSMNLSFLSFSVWDTQLQAEGNFGLSQEGITLENTDLSLSIADVFSLLSQLPPKIAEEVKLPDEIEGVLPLKLKINLPEPFNIPYGISINDLQVPAMNIRAEVSDGVLRLVPPGMRRLTADDISAYINCIYNPRNITENSAEISLSMNGEGLHIENFTSVNQLDSITQQISGSLKFNSQLTETLAYFLPKSIVKIAGHLDTRLNFRSLAENYGRDGFKDIRVKGDIRSGALKIKDSGLSVNLKNLISDFDAKVPEYPLNDYKGTGMLFDIKADSVAATGDGFNLTLSGLKVNMDAMDTVSGTPDPYGGLRIATQSLRAKGLGNDIQANDIDLNINGELLSGGGGGNSNYPSYSPVPGSNDALIESRIKHTPIAIEYDGGGILSTLMGMAQIDAELKVGKGVFKNPDYLHPIYYKGVDIATNLNRLNAYASNVKIDDTEFSLSSEIMGLQPFLTSYSATPLKLTSDINFSNVDINRLSWGYYGALIKQGNDSVFHNKPFTPYTAEDSVCVLIPRNIEANIRLKSNSAEYMQYRFSPLSTEIKVKDGVATLSQLTIGAPYCSVIVDWTYSTAAIDNIFMDLKAKVENFSFAPFYKVFPSLIEKASEIENFTGNINADVSCRFQMFPDMFMNSESLAAKFDIKGTRLQFARTGKIEKITHLMLIEGDEPIHLQNLDISGSFHDNLLQVNPFKVAFNGYQLSFAGVNNTAGKMYYHIALEKSPFHLPFGVSVFGSMKHPEIRLGGTHIDDYRSEMVEDNEENKINVNIMAYLRHGWSLFIKEAAKFCR